MKSRKRRDDGWNEDRPDDGSRDNRANDSKPEDPWQGKDGYQQGTVAGYPGGGHANGAGYADRDPYGNQPPGRHGAQGYDPRGYEPGAPGYPEPRQPGGGRPAAAGYARPRFPEAEGYDFAGPDVQAYTGGRGVDPAYGNQRQADRQVNGQHGPSPASGREFLPPEETPAGNDNWAESMRPYGRLTIFTLLDDKAVEFDRLAERAAEGVRMAEPDTLVYVIHVVPKAPMQRIIYEIYRDRTAFEQHERQPHMQRFAADRTACVVATNVIDLRLKYAKVAGFGAPEAPPVPAAGRETQLDWAPRAWGRGGVPSAAGPAGQRYPEGAYGQDPGDKYPAGNGQYPAPGNGQYSAAGNGQDGNGQYGNGQYGNGQYGNGQYGNGQYGGGHHPGAANGRQRNMGRYPEHGTGRQPDSGPWPPENGGYPDRNGSGTGRYGGS
jgi:quinol monooxygenase YgiN